ncbi:hypothetical protein FACS1894168_0410 [Deltaproteobacteria bacterium]|nr:hypothetical protein FACS1894168_0410 [Deltaproteobacteria bacterium]
MPHNAATRLASALHNTVAGARMTGSQNTVAGIMGILLAAGTWAVSNTFHATMAEAGLGPDFYPKGIAILLGLTSLVLIFGHVPVTKRQGVELKGLPFARLVLLLVLLWAYTLLITRLGYFSSTIIMSFLATFICYWEIDKTKILYACVTTGVVCISIYGIFKVLFQFSLPRGILF